MFRNPLCRPEGTLVGHGGPSGWAVTEPLLRWEWGQGSDTKEGVGRREKSELQSPGLEFPLWAPELAGYGGSFRGSAALPS